MAPRKAELGDSPKINPWTIITKSDEYRKWKASVRKKFNYKCAVCGLSRKESRKTRFDCHHVHPKALYPNDMFKVENGLFLCQQHHIEEHRRMKESLVGQPDIKRVSSSFLWKMIKGLSFTTYNRRRYKKRKTLSRRKVNGS